MVAVLGMNTPATADRVALVVGNARYENTQPLANPRNDAEAIAAALRSLDFEVYDGYDLTRRAFEELIRDFARGAQAADAAVLYYAGHGLEVGNVNYLVPVDANIRDETDLKFETVTLDDIIGFMERENRTNLIFLDACRDNPMARNLSLNMGTRSVAVGRGLAPVDTGVGTLIAYATQPGNVALDGIGQHSPFTDALLAHIATPELDVEIMMRSVRRDVMRKTSGQQVPWSSSSLTGSFVFQPEPAESVVPASLPPVAPEQAAETIPQVTPPIGKELELTAIGRETEVDQNAASTWPDLEPQTKRELAFGLQTELNRLGCNAGTPDGIWGQQSRAALTRFTEYAPPSGVETLEPTKPLLDHAKQFSSRVCPLTCKVTETLTDGACLLKTCAKGERLSSRGKCYTPQARRPSKRSTAKSSSSCFSYNGQTYCD
jgi:hypothetical protein